jgi:DNA-binding XRE family transcriptional regulator
MPEAVRFHNRVKTYRVDHGLSRRELADRVEVHPQTIGAIERGQFNPTIEVALRLGEVLGVGLDALFSRTGFGGLEPVIKKTGGARAPPVSGVRSARCDA